MKSVENYYQKFADCLNVHPSKAQIFLEVNNQNQPLEKALNILIDVVNDNMNLHTDRVEYRQWILFFLPSEHMMKTVLTLTEAGFSKLKAIKAQNIGPLS